MNNKKHIPLLLGRNNWGRAILSFSLYILLSLSVYAQSSASLNTAKEHDEDNGTYNSIVKINDSNNTYLMAFTGYGGSAGYMKSFTKSKDGDTITPLTLNGSADYNFDPKKGIFNSLIQLNTDIFVLAYTGVGDDWFIKTFKVAADGKTITTVDTKEHDDKQGQHNSLIRLDANTVALAYYGEGGTGSQGGYIKTFTIADNGSAITEVAVKNYKAGSTRYNSLVKVDLNTLAVAYNGGGGYLETLDIADDGKSLTQVKRFQFDKNSYGIYNDLIIGGSREKFVLAYHGNEGGQGGMIKTFTIATDGTITHEASLKHSSGSTFWNKLITVSSETYALFYRDPSSGRGKVKTLYIPEDVKLISAVTDTEYYSGANSHNSPIKITIQQPAKLL